MVEIKLFLDTEKFSFVVDQIGKEVTSWNYMFRFENLRLNNGNGSNKITIFNVMRDPTSVELNGWTLHNNITTNFDWTNERAQLNISDNKGVNKSIDIVSNNQTIFSGRFSQTDTETILKKFIGIARHRDWDHVDLLSSREAIENEILKLQDKLGALEMRLSDYQEI